MTRTRLNPWNHYLTRAILCYSADETLGTFRVPDAHLHRSGFAVCAHRLRRLWLASLILVVCDPGQETRPPKPAQSLEELTRPERATAIRSRAATEHLTTS